MNKNELKFNSTNKKKEKQINNISKSFDKNSVTHTDFMNFLDPFYDSIDEKKYLDVIKENERKDFKFNKDKYNKYIETLREWIGSSYIFDDNVEIEDVEFKKELIPEKEIKLKGNEIEYFQKINFLDKFQSEKLIQAKEKYKKINEKNNQMKRLMKEILPSRIKTISYFKAFNLIHKELEEIYKKRKGKKRKKIIDIEEETMEEYLLRMEEFFDTFGTSDQFSGDEYIYTDIFNCSNENKSEDEFSYL
jgi:hypothetical protein